MTAYLFIPSTIGTPVARRVDFNNIASLFSEADEPLPLRGSGRRAMLAVLLAILTAIGVVGDLVLVGYPERVAAQVPTPQTILTLDRATTPWGQKVFSTTNAI